MATVFSGLVLLFFGVCYICYLVGWNAGWDSNEMSQGGF